MNNIDKLNKIFSETFQVEVSEINDDFSIETFDNWDSVLQLSLVTSIEDTFDIMLDSDDIIDMKSYQQAKEIILKYGIEL